jgi:hypothetical protein
MPRFPRLQASFVLLLVWESACQRRRHVAVPLAAPPAAIQPAPAATAPAVTNTETPSPAATAPHTTPAPPSQEASPYQINKPPPPPAPAVKKSTRPTTVPAAAPIPTPPAPAPPPPKLGDILTADEQKQYNAAIDQSLSRAQTSLNLIGGRQLNKVQQAEVEQIRNFMQQALSARASDPAGAKSLAERAEVLARDLAKIFR